MNDEQFEALMGCLIGEVADRLRARDTAQREALGAAIDGAMKWEKDLKDAREALTRVEAERDAARSRQEHTQSTLRTVLAELQSSQAQLAEAVGIIRDVYIGSRVSRVEAQSMQTFLARLAQAEQQEANPQLPLRNPRSAKFQAAMEETFQKFESMSYVELEAVVAAHMPKQEAQGDES